MHTDASCSICFTARAAGIRRRGSGWAYERKRGKLDDLNALLRGGHAEAFSLIVGATARPRRSVKYVITLDTDTQLPRDAARQFVGAMAHPLNTARFDEPGATRAGRW